jgi:hypothetical protein
MHQAVKAAKNMIAILRTIGRKDLCSAGERRGF